MNYYSAVKALCERLGMTHQHYYQERTRRQRREVDARHVEDLLLSERRVQPRLGGRKLLHILALQLAEDGITLGRDRFFEVLWERGLLLERLPSFTPRTTNSRHSLPCSAIW
jgi:hypothetical protein